MAFNGNEGEFIDPALAQKWIDNYQKSAGPNAMTAYFYGFRKIEELFAQQNAVGVRIYYALDDEGKQRMVLVGVTAEEKNIGKLDGSKSDGKLLDVGTGCPPYCNNKD